MELKKAFLYEGSQRLLIFLIQNTDMIFNCFLELAILVFNLSPTLNMGIIKVP
jgi:hypothetical protein